MQRDLDRARGIIRALEEDGGELPVQVREPAVRDLDGDQVRLAQHEDDALPALEDIALQLRRAAAQRVARVEHLEQDARGVDDLAELREIGRPERLVRSAALGDGRELDLRQRLGDLRRAGVGRRLMELPMAIMHLLRQAIFDPLEGAEIGRLPDLATVLERFALLLFLGLLAAHWG